MAIQTGDLALLRTGQPPRDPELLAGMTVGRELWLDRFHEHYLENFILQGGSKVKVLVGSEGSGKTHLLRCVEADARALGYETVFISLRESGWRLSDIVSLYKAVVAQVDREELLRGLCRRVAEALDFGPDHYNGSGPLLPLLVEEIGYTQLDAGQKLQRAIVQTLSRSDVSPSFRRFACAVTEARMRGVDDEERDTACWKWFAGERLDPREKRPVHLYDRLTKPTGRVWLYSLARLISLSGRAGLILLLDDLESITERDESSGRYRYTPNATKDTYELIRQLVDDVEFLRNIGVLLAGRPVILEDERRGFKSYDALWMRLQTGLTPLDNFSPFADTVEVDKHFETSGGPDLATAVGERLQMVFAENGIPRRYRPLDISPDVHPLRGVTIETAMMTNEEGHDHGAI